MSSPGNLNNIDILRMVVRAQAELDEVAQWAHVLQEKIDTDGLSFPLTDAAQLNSIFARGSEAGLVPPPQEAIPPGLLPIEDMVDFIRKAAVVKRVCMIIDPLKWNPNRERRGHSRHA